MVSDKNITLELYRYFWSPLGPSIPTRALKWAEIEEILKLFFTKLLL